MVLGQNIRPRKQRGMRETMIIFVEIFIQNLFKVEKNQAAGGECNSKGNYNWSYNCKLI